MANTAFLSPSNSSVSLSTKQEDLFNFEKIDMSFWTNYIHINRNLVFYTGFLYIAVIFSLKRWMRNRKAFELRMPLFLWNLALGVFSILGFVRSFPQLVEVTMRTGLYQTVCAMDMQRYGASLWFLLFVWSKYVELGDTIFIVLRKRPLIFIQYYHHVITMTAVWLVIPNSEPVTVIFATINYFIHMLMYPYFALRAIGVKVPRSLANIITTLQFVQMVVGMGINLLSLLYLSVGYPCNRHPTSIKIMGLVYGSFFLLFGNLFYKSVLKKSRKKIE